jgi:RNA polymerase sigma factor (sigma-70 family)
VRRWQHELEELMSTRHHVLVGYAVMLSGDPAVAEDLVQEAVVATFASRGRFDDPRSAEAYVRKAIASRFIDERRRHGRDNARVERLASSVMLTTEGPEREVSVRTDIARALQLLPPRERACVVLRYLDQLSTVETAEALGLSTGAVKRYLSDGIRNLNPLLGVSEPLDAEEPVDVSERRHRRG